MKVDNADSYVIDCNIIAKWFIEENDSDKALNFLERAIKNEIILYAPDLIENEFLNVLTKYNKLKTLTDKDCKKYFEAFNQLCNQQVVRIIPLNSYKNEIMNLALLQKTSYYDAEYLFLAKKLGFELITFDKYLSKVYEKVK